MGVFLERPGVQAEIKLRDKQEARVRAVEQHLERTMANVDPRCLVRARTRI